MKSGFRKTLSFALAVVMMITAIPALKLDSKAVVADYNATAAVEYAKRYALSYNKEWFFYVEGGDCANFISQCLYAGGLKMNKDWYCMDYTSTGYRLDSTPGSFTDGNWIRAHNMKNYLEGLGATVIVNPSAYQFELGDYVFYNWDNNYKIDHSAIVTGFDGGVPLISCHSTPEVSSKLDVRYNFNNSGNTVVYLVKMNGRKCYPNNAESYDVYRVNGQTSVYGSAGGNRIGYSGYNDAIRITKTQSVGGVNYGYGLCNRYGTYGWVKLSACTKITSWSKIDVNHILGPQYTVVRPTCVTAGKDRRDCSRCDYYVMIDTDKGGHKPGAAATCTKAQVCTACGLTLVEPLGHIVGEWETVEEPTCTATGKAIKYCSRYYPDYMTNCSEVYAEKVLPVVEHNLRANTDGETCTGEGYANYLCNTCNKSISYANTIESGGDIWTAWVDTPNTSITDPNNIEIKTEYRSRNKEYTESTANRLSGWTLYDTTWYWPSFTGPWHESSTPVYASDSREVRTETVTDWTYKTVYYYYRYANCSQYAVGQVSYRDSVSGGSYYYEYVSDTQVPYKSPQQTNGVEGYGFPVGNNWILVWKCNPFERQVKDQQINRTIYKYRDRSKVYEYHFYRYTDWTGWSETADTASTNHEVETRTRYRYKLEAIGHDEEHAEIAERKYETCVEPGYIKYKCVRDNYGTICNTVLEHMTETTAPTGHDMHDDWVVFDAAMQAEYPDIKVPDLIDDGDEGVAKVCKIRFCHNLDRNTDIPCDYYELNVSGHNWKDEIITYPTCTETGIKRWTCSVHGETRDEELPATGHGYDESSETYGKYYTEEKPADCVTDGYMRYYCTNDNLNTEDECDECDAFKETAILALGHDEVPGEGLPATCEEDGLTAGVYCSRECIYQTDGWLVAQEVIPALGHSPAQTDVGSKDCILHNDETFISKHIAVNCGDSTDEIYQCTRENARTGERCEYIEKNSEYLDHNFEYWKETPADCNVPRKVYMKCTNCDASYDYDDESDSGKALGHEFLKKDGTTTQDEKDKDILYPIELQEKTAQQPGVYACECIRYGVGTCTKKLYITDGDCEYELSETTEATCLMPEIETYTCRIHGESYNTTIGDALGHDYSGDYTVMNKATCIKDGKKQQICVRVNNGVPCDALLDEQVIPMRSHNMGAWTIKTAATCTEKGEAIRVCLNTDETDEYAACTYSESEPVPELGHDFGEWYVFRESTYKEKGEERCDCSRCDEFKSRELPLLEREWNIFEIIINFFAELFSKLFGAIC